MNQADLTKEQTRQLIRKTGLRVTPARLAVLHLLWQSTTPLSHAEVSKQLDFLGIDVATVFRNLKGLIKVGLLRKVELGDHVWRFEAIKSDSPDFSMHPHFLCTKCGSVTCLAQSQLSVMNQQAVQAVGAVGEVTEILLRGRCNNCLQANDC